MGLSQPAVSKAIAELEHAVGVRLLDRSMRGVEPTRYGHALLRCSAAIFDDVRQGVQEIEFLADPTAGEVRIGCGEVHAAGLLPAIIERLSLQYPRVVCHLDQAATASTPQFRELRERQVDLVLGYIEESHVDDDVNADVLFHDRTFVVAGKKSKWARRREVTLAELVDEPWLLLPPTTLSHWAIEEAFAARGLKMPKPAVVASSIHLRNSLLPTGRFLAYLPSSFMHFGAMRSAFKVLPVDFPVKPRPLAVIMLKNRMLNPAARLFLDCAREVAKPLVGKVPKVLGGNSRTT
jgi:DNA-binding transcriptional LysR family regulator